jgi:hypothetical protein
VHPAFPAPLLSRDNDTQTSGASRRENADAYLLFEIESKCHHVIASAAKQSILSLLCHNGLLRFARNDADGPICMPTNVDAHPLFEARTETLSASLRGALAAKQSIFRLGAAVRWIASLRSQ